MCLQCCKKKLWKQVGTASSSSTAANAAYTLKKAYTKYLLNYECRFERGGVDPAVILAAVDTKKDRNRNAPSPGLFDLILFQLAFLLYMNFEHGNSVCQIS